MKDTFSGMKFEWLPMEVSPQWRPVTRFGRKWLGYLWRPHYEWDCAAPDPGFAGWKRTISAAYQINTVVLTPMGKMIVPVSVMVLGLMVFIGRGAVEAIGAGPGDQTTTTTNQGAQP